MAASSSFLSIQAFSIYTSLLFLLFLPAFYLDIFLATATFATAAKRLEYRQLISSSPDPTLLLITLQHRRPSKWLNQPKNQNTV
jgi:hypothetical protein